MTENQLNDKMLLCDCINDITDTAINAQIKLADQYVKDYLSNYDLVENDNSKIYIPKKIVFQHLEKKLEISQSEIHNNNNLSIKDFKVSGKFKVISEKNKFLIDFTNQKGIELDFDITFGKIDDSNNCDEINALINNISEGKNF
jgi:hypothetical protein